MTSLPLLIPLPTPPATFIYFFVFIPLKFLKTDDLLHSFLFNPPSYTHTSSFFSSLAKTNHRIYIITYQQFWINGS